MIIQSLLPGVLGEYTEEHITGYIFGMWARGRNSRIIRQFAPRRFAFRSQPCIAGRRPNGYSGGTDRVADAVFNQIYDSNFRIDGRKETL